MLLRHRAAGITPGPANTTKDFRHLDDGWIAVVRWLQANRVECVLVGAIGEAIRGNVRAKGPVAIVPAPYRRNFERLSRALSAANARLRLDAVAAGASDTVPVKMTGEKLARGQRWTFRCGEYDLDVEGRPERAPSYQELLYDAGRFEIASDVSVEVASPEDIERYVHMQKTGVAPEITITRNAHVENA
jgi:hypothetical protein